MMRNLSLKFTHSSVIKVISSASSYSMIRHSSNSNVPVPVPVPVRYRDTQVKSEFLTKAAGLPREKALSSIRSIEILRKTPLDSMKQSFDVLKDLGYGYAVKIHPELLCINCAILKNRILLLEDCKFNKNKIPELLVCFDSLTAKKLSILKHFDILPPESNLIENFFRVCDIPLRENTIESDDLDDFKTVYCKFYKFYVQRELGLSDETLENVIKPVKWISFKYLKYNINFARDIFHINNKDIQFLKYVLHAYPDALLYLYKSLQSDRMKKMVRKNPKMFNVSAEVIAKNSRFLKEKNISEKVPSYIALLTMQSELNLDRLSRILDSYELKPYINHPRLLDLIKKAPIANERLGILKELNMRCVTLNQLTSKDELFVRHISNGIDKTRANDKFTFLSYELPYTKHEIKAKLLLNPYYGYVPLYIVDETLKYLKTTGFSAEDIFISLPLVLYHKPVVENAVMELVPKLLKSMDYPSDFEKTELKPFLPLALYCIEKQHNFTGNGVWIQKNSDTESLAIESV